MDKIMLECFWLKWPYKSKPLKDIILNEINLNYNCKQFSNECCNSCHFRKLSSLINNEFLLKKFKCKKGKRFKLLN